MLNCVPSYRIVAGTAATSSPPTHAWPLTKTFFAPNAAPPLGVILIVVAPVFVTAGMNVNL
jgi:hypothetical protein